MGPISGIEEMAGTGADADSVRHHPSPPDAMQFDSRGVGAVWEGRDGGAVGSSVAVGSGGTSVGTAVAAGVQATSARTLAPRSKIRVLNWTLESCIFFS